MDPLILRHLACPILPKKFMSQPEPGGLSNTGAQGHIEIVNNYEAKISIAFYIL